ncbi:hypothetical protein [Methanocalculus sp. MC3]
MNPPDQKHREQIREERIRFVLRSAEWVRRVPNKVWSREQSAFINQLLANRHHFPLTMEEYLHMVETAKIASRRRSGSPPMPEWAKV